MTEVKKIIFVSTGRCGTRRIYEILKLKCPNIVVQHQMKKSRLANIIGNIMYYLGQSDHVKTILYDQVINQYVKKDFFISTDPLTAMVIPEHEVLNPYTMIVHIYRDRKEFADSIFKISRKRVRSFIAHNFIPFWQISILPFENVLNKKILDKYMKVCDMKNKYFEEKYSKNPNYIHMPMNEVFDSSFLQNTINCFCDENITVSAKELSQKSNSI
jgi:hypothetical protein